MSNEIFSVHGLEEYIAFKSSLYLKKIETENPIQILDIGFMKNYINDELLTEFSKYIFDLIKPMNGQDSYRTLSLANNQYQIHSYNLESSRYLFLSNFHHHYLAPVHVVFNIQSYEKGFANDVWNIYKEHYHLYKDLITGLLYDLKQGLLGSCPSFITEELPASKNLKHRDTDSFISHLVCYVPNTGTTLSFKKMLQENMVYFRKEVFSNLENMPKDNNKHYLKRLRYEFEIKNKLATISFMDIQVWLTLYHIESEDEIRYNSTDNPINKILALGTPTLFEKSQEGFNKNTIIIQEQFYTYYYGYYIRKVLTFLDGQIYDQNPYINHHSVDNDFSPETYPRQEKPPHTKLKTNLTVPQLAFLFKLLADLNPPIFDIKSKKELYQFIEANFLTTGKHESGPTVAKLNNLNSAVDDTTVEYWIPKIKNMLEEARKIVK